MNETTGHRKSSHSTSASVKSLTLLDSWSIVNTGLWGISLVQTLLKGTKLSVLQGAIFFIVLLLPYYLPTLTAVKPLQLLGSNVIMQPRLQVILEFVTKSSVGNEVYIFQFPTKCNSVFLHCAINAFVQIRKYLNCIMLSCQCVKEKMF